MQWARSYRQWTLVAGGDVLDNRGTDLEELSEVSLSARQRGEGVYGEVLWQPSTWSIAFSSRFDHFGSFDARQSGGTPQPLPSISENVFNPRLGVVKKINGTLSLTGSGFRAFRGPTMNELYRQGQVGQQITLANPSLRAERATGFEFGALVSAGAAGVGAGELLLDAGEPAGGGGDAEFDAYFDVVDAGESGAVDESGADGGVGDAPVELWMTIDWRISVGVLDGDEVSGGSDAGGEVDAAGAAEYGDAAVAIFAPAAGGFERRSADQRAPVR